MPSGTTPLQVADELDSRATAATAAVATLRGSQLARENAELAATLDDMPLMADLGQYYAAKIRGATSLAKFRQSKHRRIRPKPWSS